MSDVVAPLRQQFRGVLQERAEKLISLLGTGCNAAPGDAARRDLLGELHTLKGEAKMLGWASLATLAHALEERLGAAQPDQEQAAVVLDAILLSFGHGASAGEAESLWRTAFEALTGEALPPAPDHEEWDGGAQTLKRPPELEREEVNAPSRWVRVEARMVEKLGESLALLSTDFARFSQRARDLRGERVNLEAQELESESERLRAVLSDLVQLSLGLRLTSVEPTFARLAAHARTLGAQKGKQLDVIITSHGARVEREVIERLSEPLLHLVSNAVDHGIEVPEARGEKPSRARIELSAESQGARVLVKIRDDGRGIDRHAVFDKAMRHGKLPPHATVDDAFDALFLPGFSTREEVDEVSGRGVGLDVVRRTADALGVSISVESSLGVGTTFTLAIPAALTKQDLLVLRVGETLCGIPGHLVLSVTQALASESRQRTFRYRDETLPLRSLAATLDLPSNDPESFIVVLEILGKRVAVSAAQVQGHLDLVRRPVAPRLAKTKGICASALTDDAELVLVLDEGHFTRRLANSTGLTPRAVQGQNVRRPRVLVVDDSVVVRNLLEGVFVAAGYEVSTAENGVVALNRIASFQPGLVLSDIEMPIMGGFELLRNIRERDEFLPVVLVTARSSPEDQRKAANLGANAYVTKGEFESESLVSVVGRLYREG